MEAILRFFAILQADLRERTRSPRFWVMLVLVLVGSWYCFPSDDASYVVFSTQGARGFYSSAWVGLGMSLVLSFMLGLVGFYLVRGTLVRDFETRVWQLLVATPMTRAGFLLAKWASHMLVLLSIAGLALAVGLAAQWLRGEDRVIDLFELIKPTLLISLPAIALSAMFAVWFDLLPWLRKTLGNVIFFFLWMFMIAGSLAPLEDAGPEALQNWRSDPAGMVLVARDLNRVRTEQTGEDAGFGFNLGGPRKESGVERFEWRQWQPRPMDVLGRLLWFLAAFIGVVAAAPLLDWAAARSDTSHARKAQGSGRKLVWVDVLLRPLLWSRVGILAAAEIKLTLRQRRIWWWLAALGLMIAGVFCPRENLNLLLIFAWALPMDILARTALRERESHTGDLIFSAPAIVWRLLGSRVLTGFSLSFALVFPAWLRFVLADDAGALALPVISLALVVLGLLLGVLCRNARIFELLVLLVAYLGLNGAPVADVTSAPLATATFYGLFTVACAVLLVLLWPRHTRR